MKYFVTIITILFSLANITTFASSDRQYGNKIFKNIDGDEACRTQYGNDNLYAHTDNWQDPYSWVCRYNTEVGGINVGGIDIYTYCKNKFKLTDQRIGKTAFDWVCGESPCEIITSSEEFRGRSGSYKAGKFWYPVYSTMFKIKTNNGEYESKSNQNIGDCYQK